MSAFQPIDLAAVQATGDGVAWSAGAGGLNVNLVVLGPGAVIDEHGNDEVDVLVVVVGGAVAVTVDGERHHVAGAVAGVIPRGAVRRVEAGPDGARYLSVHRARGPLGVRPRG